MPPLPFNYLIGLLRSPTSGGEGGSDIYVNAGYVEAGYIE